MKTLIPRLLERGHVCVTVSELLGFEAVVISDEPYIYEAEHAVHPALLR